MNLALVARYFGVPSEILVGYYGEIRADEEFLTGGHGQGALEVVFTLGCRMLNTRAQGQFQAIAKAAQIHCKRAVAVHSCIGAPHQLFLGRTVVHGKGIQINGGVAASESSEVNGLAVDATAQQLLVHLGDQVKPGSSMGIKALTHSRARLRTDSKPRARMKKLFDRKRSMNPILVSRS